MTRAFIPAPAAPPATGRRRPASPQGASAPVPERRDGPSPEALAAAIDIVQTILETREARPCTR